jgi:hypothetical protein
MSPTTPQKSTLTIISILGHLARSRWQAVRFAPFFAFAESERQQKAIWAIADQFGVGVGRLRSCRQIRRSIL